MIPQPTLRAVEETTVTPLTDAEVAERLRSERQRLVQSGERYWVETSRGFFEGLHPLARCTLHEAQKKPSPWCLGYRIALDEASISHANASIPTHLLTNLQELDLDQLGTAHIRRDIRSVQKLGISLHSVGDCGVIGERGYAIMLSWRERLGIQGTPPSQEEFLKNTERKIESKQWAVIAGVEGATLLGFCTVWAAGKIGYLQDLFVSTESLKTGLSAALTLACVKVFQRSGCDQVSNGPHRPEGESLARFKIRQGFDVVRVPSFVWINPLARAYLRRKRPYLFYRLTGELPLPATSETPGEPE